MLREFSVLFLSVVMPVFHGVFAQSGASLTGMPQTASAEQAAPPERIRVAPDEAARRVQHMVDPVYPQIARVAQVQGTITLHIIIGQDGAVKELQYLSGPPLLMRAAMDAVKQWRFDPFLLYGQPMEMDTTVSVVFWLGQAKAADVLAEKPYLADKLQALLPANISAMDAANGYKKFPDLSAAVFAARDLGIPFAQLKCSELGRQFCNSGTTAKGMSLEKAIHALKPEMSKEEVKKAEKKAKAEAKAIS